MNTSDNMSIPNIGFGTYKMENPEETYQAVSWALEAGYKLIDTASVYKNEEYIGRALKNSGIPRNEIFLTSKVWNDMQGYNTTIESCYQSLDKLQTNYLDLFLIHWPVPFKHRNNWKPLMKETWEALEYLKQNNIVKHIGVSNFKIHHLEYLLSITEVMPYVNQIELHPGHISEDIIKYCKNNNIKIEAWAPLGQSKLIEHEIIRQIAEKYQKTSAQIILRWSIQCGYIPLPKSSNKERIFSNIDVFNFNLLDEDINIINNIPPTAWSRLDPDRIFF